MGIVFREAAPADVPGLAELAGELGHPTTPDELAARLAQVLRAPTHAVLVAEREGVVLGWVHVQEYHALTSVPSGLVSGLVVRASVRRSGLGRELLARAERWALGRGLARMRLRSRRERRGAHAFYRAQGYAVTVRQLQFVKPLTEPRAPDAAPPA